MSQIQQIVFNADLSHCYKIDGIVEILMPQLLSHRIINTLDIKNMFEYVLDFVQNNRLKWFAEKNPTHVYDEEDDCCIPEPLIEDVKAYVLSEFAESFELYFLNCYVLKDKMLFFEESFKKLAENTHHPQCVKALADMKTIFETRKNTWFTTIKPYIQSL
jgi:hypothetical protein